MTTTDHSWLLDGQGLVTPTVEWSVRTRGPLVEVRHAPECQETFAADISGSLYRLNIQGEITRRKGKFPHTSRIYWCSSGELGVVCQKAFKVSLVNRDFEVEWEAKFREDVRAVAISHNGDYVAVALSDSQIILFDRYKKRIAKVPTRRSLDDLHFVWEEPAIVGSSDLGLLCKFSLKGKIDWMISPTSRSSQAKVNSDGSRIYLSAHNRGIQVYDGEGELLGAYQIKGIPQLLSLSPAGNRLAVLTTNALLFWMDLQGKLLWVAPVPEQIVSIDCDGFGSRLILGLETGEITCLNWSLEN
ncbi:hypothetical protein Pla110_26210 [Polystyrenella longa]|uniref:WD domain, G-beta repeat n=1 Tax=Polystyrenella longa TaxID=2528007 RepID=A0A518CNS7_9PLAN|nr:hypothetical protein [Polystyrenella longa]QDU80885.1 hypothetical protein Pla110_26210 [Polystyrenella longa]